MPSAVARMTLSVRVVDADPRSVARAISRRFPQVEVAVTGSRLTLRGSPSLVHQARSVIARLDASPGMQPYVAVYHLRHAAARAVGEFIAREFPGTEVAVDQELNALAIRASGAQQARCAAAIANLDTGPAATPSPPGLMVQQPGEVGSLPAGNGTSIQVVSLKAAAPGPQGSPSSAASDIAATVQQVLQPTHPDLRITVPPNSTQLILTGTPASLQVARALINQLDVAQKLVVLDTEILEVDETAAKNLGLNLSPVIATTYSETTPPPPPTGGTPPPVLGLQQFTRTPLSFAAALNFLIQRGSARVLADPRITTISGRTATIRAGDNISILTTTGGGPGTIATTQLQTFQTGVSLDITPVINAGNFITVTLHPTVNSLSGVVNGIPQISTRETETTVAMQEDQTLVIGGLIQDSTSRSETKIPILGDLPLVGPLFREETLNRSRNELVVTVTPHILYPGRHPARPGPTPLPLPVPSPLSLPTMPAGGLLSAGVRPTPVPPPATAALSIAWAHGASRAAGPSSVMRGVRRVQATAGSGGAARLPESDPNQAQPTPPAFAEINVFRYGGPPASTYAAAGDPVHVFYVRLAPTVLHDGQTLLIDAITTTNAKRVTLGAGGMAVDLRSVGTGMWQAAFTFHGPPGLAASNRVLLSLTAAGAAGQSASMTIPISIVP
jgi:type II secretory pathway component GspD/PulD (secretin)